MKRTSQMPRSSPPLAVPFPRPLRAPAPRQTRHPSTLVRGPPPCGPGLCLPFSAPSLPTGSGFFSFFCSLLSKALLQRAGRADGRASYLAFSPSLEAECPVFSHLSGHRTRGTLVHPPSIPAREDSEALGVLTSWRRITPYIGPSNPIAAAFTDYRLQLSSASRRTPNPKTKRKA